MGSAIAVNTTDMLTREEGFIPLSPSSRPPALRFDGVEVSAEYADVRKAVGGKNDLPPGWYVFQMTLGESGPGSADDPDMKEVQKRLSFDHIAAVVGHVKMATASDGFETPTKCEYVFEASVVDFGLIPFGETLDECLVVTKVVPFRASSNADRTLRFVKSTTADHCNNRRLWELADAWECERPFYDPEYNTCANFYDHVVENL